MLSPLFMLSSSLYLKKAKVNLRQHKYYEALVRVCVRVCLMGWVCVRVYVCVCWYVCACVRACMRMYIYAVNLSVCQLRNHLELLCNGYKGASSRQTDTPDWRTRHHLTRLMPGKRSNSKKKISLRCCFALRSAMAMHVDYAHPRGSICWLRMHVCLSITRGTSCSPSTTCRSDTRERRSGMCIVTYALDCSLWS